jgi:hypothetical protein
MEWNCSLSKITGERSSESLVNRPMISGAFDASRNWCAEDQYDLAAITIRTSPKAPNLSAIAGDVGSAE